MFPTIWRASRHSPSADSEGTGDGFFAPEMSFALRERQSKPSRRPRPANDVSTLLEFCQTQSFRIIPVDGSLECCTGPHGAPDFFTAEYIDTFFSTEWKVHYNSNRTGVRLIGPKPNWTRTDGGEAGLHPSNIHDNAYAVGAVDFTGDMPILLGPDGPSLGGFVCPAVVVDAELWKLGQLKAGDTVRFRRLTVVEAEQIEVHAGT